MGEAARSRVWPGVLAVISPAVAAAGTLAAFLLPDGVGKTVLATPLEGVFVIGNLILAAVGSAAGVMLLPRVRAGYRVAGAVSAVFVSAAVYWGLLCFGAMMAGI